MGQDKKYSDDKLLSDLCSGGAEDIIAFERLFHRYYPMVLGFTKALVKIPAVAEDIAQNTFMKLWLNRLSLRPGLSLKNYLCVLSRNESINFLRSSQSKGVRLRPLLDMQTEDATVDEWMNFAETNARIRNNIDALPPQRRNIFKMSRYGHLSNEEIALKLNISVRTVEKHIELALKDLRRSIS